MTAGSIQNQPTAVEMMRNQPRMMTAGERAELDRIVKEHNGRLNDGRVPQQQLGKDEFLKLLVTQLSYQDPMSPMEDKQFIAQMAQFSSLEQMTNIAGEFNRLTNLVTGNEAAGALGRSVELVEGENVVQGTVKAVTRGDDVPQIMVNGTYYSWDQVTRVFEE
jgi:flagellar basal-body rod modification protein FlgD